MPESRTKPRWLPSPGKLFVVVILLALLLAWLQIMLPLQRNAALIHELYERGEQIEVTQGGPDWLRERLGDENMMGFDSVTSVTVQEELGDPGQLMRLLAAAQTVREMNLRLPDANVDDEFGRLSCLPNLEGLDVYGGLTDAGFVHLRKCRALEGLSAHWLSITDDGLQSLDGAGSLKFLYLECCDHLTDVGIKSIAGSSKLESIGIHDCSGISDNAVAALRKMDSLEQVILGGRKFTDAAMMSIGGMPQLQKVILYDVAITDQGLAELARLPRLKVLWISAPQTTDAGLLPLTRLENLSELTLYHDNFTDDAIPYLLEMQHLATVEFCGTRISESEVERLRSAKPFTRITLLP